MELTNEKKLLSFLADVLSLQGSDAEIVGLVRTCIGKEVDDDTVLRIKEYADSKVKEITNRLDLFRS